MKCETGQNAQLVGRIVALHIGRGIRLRQSQPLCIPKHVLIFQSFPAHAGKNVVGGAVHDAVQIADSIGLQAFLHGMDDGDGSAHRRLVVQTRAAFPGGLLQLVPVQGEGHLVGGHQRLALFQRRQIPLKRGLLAAKKFQNDGNLRVVQQVVHPVGQHALRQLDFPFFMHVPHQRPLHFKVKPRAMADLLRKARKQLPYAAANVAAAEKSDFDRRFHPSVSPLVSGCVHTGAEAPSGLKSRPICR